MYEKNWQEAWRYVRTSGLWLLLNVFQSFSIKVMNEDVDDSIDDEFGEREKAPPHTHLEVLYFCSPR